MALFKNTFFIIDKALQADIEQLWYSEDQYGDGLHFSLLNKTRYEQLNEVGPQLFVIDQDHILCNKIREVLETTPAGIQFETEQPVEQVLERCRWMLQIETEHGSALNRFYEPRSVRACIEVLGEERWWSYWQCAEQVIWFDQQWQQIVRHETQPLREINDEEHFSFTQQQLDEIASRRRDSFILNLQQHYSGHLPEVDDQFSWLQQIIDEALANELDNHDLQESWLRAVLQYGENRLKQPDIKRVLQQTELIADQRWQLVEQILSEG